MANKSNPGLLPAFIFFSLGTAKKLAQELHTPIDTLLRVLEPSKSLFLSRRFVMTHRYFCHACQAYQDVVMAPTPTCCVCHSQFVEQVSHFLVLATPNVDPFYIRHHPKKLQHPLSTLTTN